jgi:hypothetical protein
MYQPRWWWVWFWQPTQANGKMVPAKTGLDDRCSFREHEGKGQGGEEFNIEDLDNMDIL